jgi:dodecin
MIIIIISIAKGREDAAQVAVNEAMKSLRDIRGIEIVDQTAHVDAKTGKITQFKTCVKLSFGVEHS